MFNLSSRLFLLSIPINVADDLMSSSKESSIRRPSSSFDEKDLMCKVSDTRVPMSIADILLVYYQC